MMALRVKNLVPPVMGAKDIFPPWSIVIRAEEMEVPTKVGTFDDTIRLDKDETREFFNVMLPRVRAERGPEEFLWKFS